MLKLEPRSPPTPIQCSCNAQPPYSDVTTFVPAGFPCGSTTRQLPSQKSNCRYCGAVHGSVVACGAGVDEATSSALAKAMIDWSISRASDCAAKRRTQMPFVFEQPFPRIQCHVPAASVP